MCEEFGVADVSFRLPSLRLNLGRQSSGSGRSRTDSHPLHFSPPSFYAPVFSQSGCRPSRGESDLRRGLHTVRRADELTSFASRLPLDVRLQRRFLLRPSVYGSSLRDNRPKPCLPRQLHRLCREFIFEL